MPPNPDPRPIALFDSGEGGLTVLKHAWDLFPGENYLYAADSIHFPYGTKSLNQVRDFLWAFLDFFMTKNVKAIVVACNTATAAGLPLAQNRVPVPIIGVIEPGSRDALRYTKTDVIGVLSTEATYRSGIYPRVLQSYRPTVKVVSVPCSVLVTMAESGQTQGPEVAAHIRQCATPMLEYNADVVLLGCTHFPHMQRLFSTIIGGSVHIVDPGLATARFLPQACGPLNSHGRGHIEFFTTGDPQKAVRVARLLWSNFGGVPHALEWQHHQLVEIKRSHPV